jgi:Protein of unknown function (DUF2721)
MQLLGHGGIEPLSVVAAAVTPVVMVSATAILISGVNSRYMSIAERVRSLTRELRDASTTPQRRACVETQLFFFGRRVSHVATATTLLYVAVGCFVTVALVISVSSTRTMLLFVTLPLFVAGLGLICLALAFQLWELRDSNRTLRLEIKTSIDPGTKQVAPK